MHTILAILFLLLPSVYFGYRQYTDYSTNVTELIKSITSVSWLFLLTMLIYAAWSISTETKHVINTSLITSIQFQTLLAAYILPGLAYALIIFPSPTCEGLGIYKLFKTLGEQKLLSKALGVVILLFSYIVVFHGYASLANK